jgi:hypothetical protein
MSLKFENRVTTIEQEEERSGFVGDGASNQRFAGTGRAEQKDAARRLKLSQLASVK